MFVWTLPDVVGVILVVGGLLCVGAYAAYDALGRRLSLLARPKAGQVWVARDGTQHLVESVWNGMVRHQHNWRGHTFRDEDTIAAFRARRLRLARGVLWVQIRGEA